MKGKTKEEQVKDAMAILGQIKKVGGIPIKDEKFMRYDLQVRIEAGKRLDIKSISMIV